MLKQVVRIILLVCFSFAGTALAVEKKAKNEQKISKKKKNIRQKKSNSKFNPTVFIKNKERTETGAGTTHTNTVAPSAVAAGSPAVICKPANKPAEDCFGADCSNKKAVRDDPVEKPTAMIDNNEAITKEVMKTIRDNCAPPDSEKAFVKPVFELGIKEPEKGTSEKREMVPKIGIQAAF
jgi:hypothetical protein